MHRAESHLTDGKLGVQPEPAGQGHPLYTPGHQLVFGKARHPIPQSSGGREGGWGCWGDKEPDQRKLLAAVGSWWPERKLSTGGPSTLGWSPTRAKGDGEKATPGTMGGHA